MISREEIKKLFTTAYQKLPADVKEKIAEIVKYRMDETGVSEEEAKRQVVASLLAQFTNILDTDESFAKKPLYALLIAFRIEYSRMLRTSISASTVNIDFIPVGISPIRKSKLGLVGEAIGLEITSDGSLEPVRVIVMNSALPFLEQLSPFYRYNLTVSRSRIGYIMNTNSFILKDANPIVDPVDTEQVAKLLSKYFNARKIKIADTRKQQSQLITLPNGKVVSDPLDMRILEVVVKNVKVKETQLEINGVSHTVKRAFYIAVDETVPYEPDIDPEGEPLPEVLFAFIHPRLAIYGEDSTVLLYGSLRYVKDEENQRARAVMTAYWVIPIFVSKK